MTRSPNHIEDYPQLISQPTPFNRNTSGEEIASSNGNHGVKYYNMMQETMTSYQNQNMPPHMLYNNSMQMQPSSQSNRQRQNFAMQQEIARLENFVTMDKDKKIYIVADSANVFSGAQIIKGKRNTNIKVNLATLLPLLDCNRPIEKRFVIASFPERSNRMWRYFEQRRYDIIHERDESKIDEIIAGHIRNLLDHCPTNKTFRENLLKFGEAESKDGNLINSNSGANKLIFISGDGNSHRSHINYHSLIGEALAIGWHIELVCWKGCMNAIYDTLQNDYPMQMTIRHLDYHRNEITFMKQSSNDQNSNYSMNNTGFQGMLSGPYNGINPSMGSRPYHHKSGGYHVNTQPATSRNNGQANYDGFRKHNANFISSRYISNSNFDKPNSIDYLEKLLSNSSLNNDPHQNPIGFQSSSMFEQNQSHNQSHRLNTTPFSGGTDGEYRPQYGNERYSSNSFDQQKKMYSGERFDSTNQSQSSLNSSANVNSEGKTFTGQGENYKYFYGTNTSNKNHYNLSVHSLPTHDMKNLKNDRIQNVRRENVSSDLSDQYSFNTGDVNSLNSDDSTIDVNKTYSNSSLYVPEQLQQIQNDRNQQKHGQPNEMKDEDERINMKSQQTSQNGTKPYQALKVHREQEGKVDQSLTLGNIKSLDYTHSPSTNTLSDNSKSPPFITPAHVLQNIQNLNSLGTNLSLNHNLGNETNQQIEDKAGELNRKKSESFNKLHPAPSFYPADYDIQQNLFTGQSRRSNNTPSPAPTSSTVSVASSTTTSSSTSPRLIGANEIVYGTGNILNNDASNHEISMKGGFNQNIPPSWIINPNELSFGYHPENIVFSQTPYNSLASTVNRRSQDSLHDTVAEQSTILHSNFYSMQSNTSASSDNLSKLEPKTESAQILHFESQIAKHDA